MRCGVFSQLRRPSRHLRWVIDDRRFVSPSLEPRQVLANLPESKVLELADSLTLRWLLTREDWPRTVWVRQLPPFAIEADVRNFFEEGNFAVYENESRYETNADFLAIEY